MMEWIKWLLFAAGIIMLSQLVAHIVNSAMSEERSSFTIWYTVPDGVEYLRVRSYTDGRKIVMDKKLSVMPGQTFRIDPE